MQIIEIYRKNTTKIHLCLFLSIVLIIIGGLVLFPNIFYDNWIWKYYWGPLLADATTGTTATYNGVTAHAGYTIISEITYGILIIIALYLIYKLIKKLKITIDWKFALALMPYIIFGPVARTLEDTGYFNEPTVYWFISPLIYVQITIYAVLFLLLGYYLEKKLKNPKITVNRVIFTGGSILLIPSLYLIAIWILGARWGTKENPVVRFDVFLIVIGLVLLITGIVYLIAYLYKNKQKIAVYRNPLNLAIILGHQIDGLTSYISIKDPFMMGLSYTEKHPASDLLLNIWGPLFPIVKFLLIIVVIYVFDVLYKQELKKYSGLVNLLKICILILGFSPGLRDLLRVTMGV